jgi:hypothetical protein
MLLMSPPIPRARSQIAAELAAARLAVQQLEQELSLTPLESSSFEAQSAQTTHRAIRELVHDDGKADRGHQGDWRWPLSQREYGRYGRQMMLSGVGLPGAFLRLSMTHRRERLKLLPPQDSSS